MKRSVQPDQFGPSSFALINIPNLKSVAKEVNFKTSIFNFIPSEYLGDQTFHNFRASKCFEISTFVDCLWRTIKLDCKYLQFAFSRKLREIFGARCIVENLIGVVEQLYCKFWLLISSIAAAVGT